VVQVSDGQAAAELARLLADSGRSAADSRRHQQRLDELASEPRFLEQFAGRWVALSDGGILAESSLDELLGKIAGAGAQRDDVAIRFVEGPGRVLIL
jgi:hypothetical protein